MNMSDDVSSATLQVSMKAAEQTIESLGRATDRIIDMIAKLLQAASSRRNDRSVQSTALTDIQPGEVRIQDLIASARKNHDSLSSSEHGLTAADRKYIQKKAREYGIPVAFTGDCKKDNVFANVRTNDLSILQRICTDMMKEKLAERPEKLGNFKVQEWEIPFIAAELKKHDLAAQFGKTSSGEHFALYEKADEKAILIARGEFVRKCNELQKDMSIDKDEAGLYTIKDLRSGREISFDQAMTHTELSRELQQKFGYDENKANIACAKFGEEALQGQDKQRFFSSAPQSEFSKIDSNITVEGESIYAKPYDCWRVTPKCDGVPRLIFRDADGNFAVLNPEKMTRRKMQAALREGLKITDCDTLSALTEKAETVTDYYAKQDADLYSYRRNFSRTDFEKAKPEDGRMLCSVVCDVERMGNDEFCVMSDAETIDTGGDDFLPPTIDRKELVLSLSDKKNALAELTAIYRQQGVPQHIATQMAKDVFAKASTQCAEKVLQIEEVKLDAPRYQGGTTMMSVKCGSKIEAIDIADADQAKSDIMKKFNVTESAAVCTLDKAYEMVTEREEQLLGKYGFRDVDKWTMDEAHEMIAEIEKNDWAVPKEITPAEYTPERLRTENADLPLSAGKLDASPLGKSSGSDIDAILPDLSKTDAPPIARRRQ